MPSASTRWGTWLTKPNPRPWWGRLYTGFLLNICSICTCLMPVSSTTLYQLCENIWLEETKISQEGISSPVTRSSFWNKKLLTNRNRRRCVCLDLNSARLKRHMDEFSAKAWVMSYSRKLRLLRRKLEMKLVNCVTKAFSITTWQH